MAKIEIGSIVKSLDFVGNEEDYFVGTVIEIREEMIKARIAYQVVNGKIRKDFFGK